MQFYGSRGAMTAPQFLGDDVGLWHAGDEAWTNVREEKTRYDELGIAAGLPHWLECIRTGARPVNDGRFGRHVLETLLAAQVSARKRKAVQLRTRA